jgi:hypothetical protein
MIGDGSNTYSREPERHLLTVAKIPEPLAAACDNAALSFSTGGSAAWFAQSTEYYYDNDAAHSGAIADGQPGY